MGTRGPKPDADQAAKGYPGRRKSRADKAAAEAAKVRKLLAPSAAQADLPAMLADPKYAPAAEVWRKLAPELRRTHRLPPEAEFQFVQFCIYAQEWVTVTDDLHLNGFTQQIKTVAGGKMERRRPISVDRQLAFDNCKDLSSRFGLTPTEMYSLFKGQAAVAPSNPGLFGEGRGAGAPAAQGGDELELDGEPQPAAPAAGRIGSFGRLRSPPPGDLPN